MKSNTNSVVSGVLVTLKLNPLFTVCATVLETCRGDIVLSQFYSWMLGFDRSRAINTHKYKIHKHLHTKSTVTPTNWLSLLLSLTLSICLPMTVGLSSNFVMLSPSFKMGCVSQSDCVGWFKCLMQGPVRGLSQCFLKKLWMCELTHTLLACALCLRQSLSICGFMFFLHLHLHCFCVSECGER